MKVSYIITSWNRRNVLEEHITRVLAQTYQGKIEILACVDGSTDGTQEMLVGKCKEVPNMKWFDTGSIEVATPSKARNLGVHNATGELFVFSDDDCLPNNHLIEMFVKKYKEMPNVVQIGYRSSQQHYLDLPIPVPVEAGKMAAYEKADRKGRIDFAFFTTGSCAMAAHIARTPAGDGSLGFDERFMGYGYEDGEFAHRLRHRGYKFIWNKDAVIWHANPSYSFNRPLKQKLKERDVNRILLQKCVSEMKGQPR